MALAELVQKLRSKKQTAARSVFQSYLDSVRKLADGREIDADEVGGILDAADKSEDDLSRDVGIQTQRFAWVAQLQANRLAVADRLAAETELRIAQQRLRDAVQKLQPACDQANDKLADANHRHLTTMNADSLLAEHILDTELLEREAAVVSRLRDVHSELKPLTIDREHKASSLQNAEFTLAKLQARTVGDWIPAGIVGYFNQPRDIRDLSVRVADLQSQLRQLDAAIVPRQAEQQRLQSELLEIHQQKLQP